MVESILRNLSVEFSVKIIKLCEGIKGHYSLANQLERSGTPIGANIHEANYAHSKNDFVSKLQISLKECYETEYWLELFVKSELIEKLQKKYIMNAEQSAKCLSPPLTPLSKTWTNKLVFEI